MDINYSDALRDEQLLDESDDEPDYEGVWVISVGVILLNICACEWTTFKLSVNKLKVEL